jgi:hypothetical protein
MLERRIVIEQECGAFRRGRLLMTYREGSTIYPQSSVDAIDLLVHLVPFVAEAVK